MHTTILDRLEMIDHACERLRTAAYEAQPIEIEISNIEGWLGEIYDLIGHAPSRTAIPSDHGHGQRWDPVVHYADAIATARGLIDDGSNAEYTRGIAELIADMFGYRGASDMGEAKERIALDLGLPPTSIQ